MTATDEEMDFIRAIQAAPDDDAPRLIFADWLDEHGEDHAAWHLRKQVTHRHNNGERFYSNSSHRPLAETENWKWGLLETITSTAEWWLENAPKLTIFHPIRRVTITTILEIETAFDGEFLICYFRKGVNRSVMVRSNDVGEQLEDLLEENWPDIEFTL